jgi:cytochrome c2
MTVWGVAVRGLLVTALLAAVPVTLAVAAEPGAGDAGRGKALFTAKGCSRCHLPRGENSIGPWLEEVRRPQGAFELAGRLWNHAPAMFEEYKLEKLAWPRISEAEMTVLMVYLQAGPARDPAADRPQGEAVLVRKGCLKCHSLRGEGARIGPDLGRRRHAYDSGAAWAAAMWIHTPRMADKAREIGVLYPRFFDTELNNLVGFLRSVAR